MMQAQSRVLLVTLVCVPFALLVCVPFALDRLRVPIETFVCVLFVLCLHGTARSTASSGRTGSVRNHPPRASADA